MLLLAEANKLFAHEVKLIKLLKVLFDNVYVSILSNAVLLAGNDTLFIEKGNLNLLQNQFSLATFNIFLNEVSLNETHLKFKNSLHIQRFI